MEESVDIDTDIPHQVNDPIEIDEEEESTEGAPTSKSKGKQAARKSTQRAECWKHFIEIKENAKEWPVSASIVAKYTRPSLLRMGPKI